MLLGGAGVNGDYPRRSFTTYSPPAPSVSIPMATEAGSEGGELEAVKRRSSRFVIYRRNSASYGAVPF